jgi:hypothetical protein
MSPAERLQAFVNHSKALAEIHAAGELARRGLNADRKGPSSTIGHDN